MPKDRTEWTYYERFYKQRAQCFEVLVPYQIIINSGIHRVLPFYIRLLHLFLTNLKQLYPLVRNKLRLPAGSDAAKTNTLKLMSLKARLWSFSRQRVMRENFEKILHFKREKLMTLSKTEAGVYSKQKMRMRMQ